MSTLRSVLCCAFAGCFVACASQEGEPELDLQESEAISRAELPRQGYRHRDGVFAGTFRDVAGNELALAPTEDGGVRGQLGAMQIYEVEGRLDGDVLRARATLGAESWELTGRWNGEQLLVSFRGEELELLRWAPPLELNLGAPVADPERRWTLAVYMGGDNDLEPYALLDLAEMEKALPERGVDVVVLLDRAKDEDLSRGNWTDTRIFHVRRGEEASLELCAPGELDTNWPQTLAGFAIAAFRKFPAPRNALVIWDHGAGWSGVVSDDDAERGGRGSELTASELRSALRSIQIETPMPVLDLLAFDACSMAQLENGLNCADFARWIVASEAIVSGLGFPYEDFLASLGAGDPDPRAVASELIDAFGRVAAENDLPNATLSVLDTRALPRVALALDAAAEALLGRVDADWTRILRALFYAESYEARALRGFELARCSTDLGDLARRFRLELDSPPTELDELIEAVDAAVIARTNGENRSLSHGIALHGPRLSTQRREAHASTPIGVENRFVDLLKAMHARADADVRPLEVSDLRLVDAQGQAAQRVTPGAADMLAFRASGNGIVQVELHDFARDDRLPGWILARKTLVVDPTWPRRFDQASADEVDRVLPRFADGENDLVAEIPAVGWRVTNRTSQVLATLDQTALSLHAPFVLRGLVKLHPADAQAPEQEVEIEFSRSRWRAETVRPLPKAGESQREPRELKLSPASLVRLALEVELDGGAREQRWTDVLEWKKGLFLVLDADPPGKRRVSAVAKTLGGRERTASLDYEVLENPELARWAEGWKDFDPAMLAGTWYQHLYVGLGEAVKTPMKAIIEGADPRAPSTYRVLSVGDKDGEHLETRQKWMLESEGLPSLRIVTDIADGRAFCWYGPVYFGVRDGGAVIGMKAVNLPGVLWEWRRSKVEQLRLPEPERKD